ncbi:MAG: hypothetical protein KDC92_15620 [Bacteroidetes bacterium]|nr:hypothetical protein [Bacteroidota bacterium]
MKSLDEKNGIIMDFNFHGTLREEDTVNISYTRNGISIGAYHWLKTTKEFYFGVSAQLWANLNYIELEKTNAAFPAGFNLSNPNWQTGRFNSSFMALDVNLILLYNEKHDFAYGVKVGSYINLPNKNDYGLTNYPDVTLANTSSKFLLVPYLKVLFSWPFINFFEAD